MKDAMLTTKDNPYSPFTQFDKWRMFDESHGYRTTEYLARITVTSNDLSEDEENIAIDNAINEILYYDVLGIYKKVYEE